MNHLEQKLVDAVVDTQRIGWELAGSGKTVARHPVQFAPVKVAPPKPKHDELSIQRLPEGGYAVVAPYDLRHDVKSRAIFAATEIKDALAFVWLDLEPHVPEPAVE